jgi:hypothetical protein
MSQDTPAPAPASRQGCLPSGGIGCLTVLALLVLLQLPMLTKGCRARAAVQVGMSPAQVLEVAGDYFIAQAWPSGPGPEVQMHVGRLGVNVDGQQHSFTSQAETGQFLEQQFRSSGRAWSVSFGYITLVPRRQYFTVEFGPDGRVRSVSGLRGGQLD